MKKIKIIIVVILALQFIQCSSDKKEENVVNQNPVDPNTQTLFVNNQTYKLGINSLPWVVYNYFHINESSTQNNYKKTTFGIVKDVLIDSYATDVIEVNIAHSNTITNINGTYSLTQPENLTTLVPYAICTFKNQQTGSVYGGLISNSNGTITISDNNNGNYKITFNNVVLTKTIDNESMSISGYCERIFNVGY